MLAPRGSPVGQRLQGSEARLLAALPLWNDPLFVTAFQQRPAVEGDRPLQGRLVARFQRRIEADDIPLGAPQTMAWAIDPASKTVRSGSRLNRILLLRLDPATLTEGTRANAAAGVVAYTAICTHNGCDVTDWLGDEQVLSCPCHQTRFDPRSDGRVIEGAAPRALPALPLEVADGKLVVARTFTSRVGFEPA